MRRAITFLWLMSLLLAAPSSAFAQAQHTRPIKVIVPFPAGETADMIVRFLADDMAKELGQSVIVDNRPGASGLIGLQTAANAEPDGHTLVMGQLGNMAITPLMNKWQLDVRTQFEPVALTYTNYIVILATPSLPVKTLPELVAYSKANPGALRIGTVGLGSFPHLMFEMLRRQTGLDYTHVTYRGGTQIVPDLMAARIELSTLNFSSGLPYIGDGRLRAIATSGRVRNEADSGAAGGRRKRAGPDHDRLVRFLRAKGDATGNDRALQCGREPRDVESENAGAGEAHAH